ncbi:unnamed protein product [Discosporangium mesarthrocarpum]
MRHEERGCHGIVFVETVETAQALVRVLKALTLTAFGIHGKTPKSQVQDYVRRFQSTPSAEKSVVLVLANAAVANMGTVGVIFPAVAKVVKIVHYDTAVHRDTVASRARVAYDPCLGRREYTVEEYFLHVDFTLADDSGVQGSWPPAQLRFEDSAMIGVRQRLATGNKLVGVVGCMGSKEKSMKRAAVMADLQWDEGPTMEENTPERCGLSQQIAALKDKISVMLCLPLITNKSTLPSGGLGPAAGQKQASKELRKKMSLLGMLWTGSLSKLDVKDSTEQKERGVEGREFARTRWLDEATGDKFHGHWKGSARRGASCDPTSLEIKQKVEQAKASATEQPDRGTLGKPGSGKEQTKQGRLDVLSLWKPNPDTPDPARWGGRWGKPCAHNEVVMQHLRPFAPLEVLNTRICSRASPAPGNMGYDGCLEMLCLQCLSQQRSLTVWDDSAFHFISADGVHSAFDKRALLSLPTQHVRFLVKNLRAFTLCCGGQRAPKELLQSIGFITGLAAKQAQIRPLTVELSTRVMSYILSGDVAAWKAVSGVIQRCSTVTGDKIQRGPRQRKRRAQHKNSS